MKLKSALFIFLISMIGFTSMASTPLLEQKQKPTIEKSIAFSDVENVVNFEVISFDNSKIEVFIAFETVIEKTFINPENTVNDVGWKISGINYNSKFKQSNSLKYNRIHFVSLNNKGNILIRDNC
jgi:hypothetical protein